MGVRVVAQPGGLFAIVHSGTNTIVAWDCSRDEVIDFFVEQAAPGVREEAGRGIERAERVSAAEKSAAWAAALLRDQEYGGSAHEYFRGDATEVDA